ncbi:NADH:flavin oxidoreductase/NADH oxidase family protein [Nocardioides jiangxiensis]|uniref:NADH:flavin oxidoreductase/NADH oxidase family protein n=1 Tax=Nocardioides jiangxiensis TaxID=3064524 RepID=A0ABT9B482_9ACTN|nr:NADH:flavin oxidoreductase/NADH oxidase family protein [Nocardioides sp. WY-20]MDO7869528.1 NADH:flavin oxidoreductase/NADH oxidase family protein [Nocardioides sp. WY-20]
MIETSLTLPCGVTLPNRLAKSALSEQLGTIATHAPDGRLVKLYDRWATGGSGLLVTGNVMVDRRALGEPANVVVEDGRDLEALSAWAAAAKSAGAVALVQVNHPGRQSPRSLSPRPVAPSAIGLKGMGGAFAVPRELTAEEIADIVARYAETARVCVAAGFDGVQLHGAHGYLISQFLSPLANQRTDQYGGSTENRARFLLEIVAATRAVIGADKVLSVKLNSADFQRGGFSEDESIVVAKALEAAGIDLLEISGGTYEVGAMMGVTKRESTRQREAYFLDFAERLRGEVSLPLMVTGGFRTKEGMDEAIATGAVDVIGLGRPLAVDPDFPRLLLSGQRSEVAGMEPRSIGIRKLDAMAEVVWYTTQLWRMGRGKEPAVTKPSAVGVGEYVVKSQLPAVVRGVAGQVPVVGGLFR